MFKAVLELYKMNNGVFFGAQKASESLDIKSGHNYYFVDNILRMLKDDKMLEKGPDKKGYKYQQPV